MANEIAISETAHAKDVHCKERGGPRARGGTMISSLPFMAVMNTV